MTRKSPFVYDDDMIRDLDDFVPHDLDAPDETPPDAPDGGGEPPALLLCVAAAARPEDGFPARRRTLAGLAYRIEEALLARGAPLQRALCLGADALPFAAVTAPDALPPDGFAPAGRQAQPLFQALSQACALAASFPSPSPTRLVLLTDLPPDGLPQAMLRLLLRRMQDARPCLRAALVYCGQEPTVWTAHLRGMQDLLAPILPGDSERMYEFLLEGENECAFPNG